MFARILETVSRLVVLLGSLFPGRENCSACGALLPPRGQFCGTCGAPVGGCWTRRVKRAGILAAWSSPGFIVAALIYTASSGPLDKARSQTRALAGENETLRSDVQRLRDSPDVAKAKEEVAALRERVKAADDKLVEMAAIKQQLAVAESVGNSSESRLDEATKQLNDASIELGKLRAQSAVSASKPPDNERGWPSPPVTQVAPSPILNACELAMVGRWHFYEPELERQFVKIIAKFLFRPEADPRNQPAAHKAVLESRARGRVAIEFKNDRSLLLWGVIDDNPMSVHGTWSCSNGAVAFDTGDGTRLAYERPYVLICEDTPEFGEVRIPFKKEGT